MFPFLLHFLCVGTAVTASELKNGRVASAWYAGWHSESLPLASVSWGKYTQLTYAFATTTPDVNVLSLEDSNPDLLPQFVAEAHRNNVKAFISIGGWTGSRYFSSHFATPANRTAFVKTVTSFATKYKLDGVDFDYEYPGKQGVGCNVVSDSDTANMLAFLQELKKDVIGSKLVLSAAAGITPWIGSDGSPSVDLAPFAQVLDYIAIMDYDVWGSWASGVGPNAPLNDTCVTSPPQIGSATSAMRAWVAAGIPREKLILAVAAYGHSFSVTPTDAFGNGATLVEYPAFNKTGQPIGDEWNSPESYKDVCGALQGPEGIYTFRGLVGEDYLRTNGTPRISDNGTLSYRFDECSQTPYIYNETAQIMISYDDARSLVRKGEFVRVNDLRGFAMWEAAGDYNDVLLDALLSGMINGDPSAANLSIGDITLNSASSTSSNTKTPTRSGNGASRTMYHVDWSLVVFLLVLLCV